MGDIIQCNIKGIKTKSVREKKINLILELLSHHETKFLNLQETHLNNQDQIPRELIDLKHIYHIISSEATMQDPWSGIIIFIKKN